MKFRSNVDVDNEKIIIGILNTFLGLEFMQTTRLISNTILKEELVNYKLKTMHIEPLIARIRYTFVVNYLAKIFGDETFKYIIFLGQRIQSKYDATLQRGLYGFEKIAIDYSRRNWQETIKQFWKNYNSKSLSINSLVKIESFIKLCENKYGSDNKFSIQFTMDKDSPNKG